MITGAPAPSPTFLGSDSFLLCGRRRLRLRLPVRGLTRWGERLRWPPEPSYFPSCGRLAFGCGSPVVDSRAGASACGGHPNPRTSHLVVASPSAAAPRTSLASHPGAASAVGVRTLVLPITWSPRLRLRLPVRPSPLTLGRHRQWASALSHFLSRGRLAFGCGSPYITGPMIQGANSSSPTPESSLFDRLPEATATISSKICRPTSGNGVPSRMTPQLISMSSSMWRYMSELVAILIEGTDLQPNTEPRPVVKQMRLQPPATRPVMETGSCPGVSMKTKPRVVIGSP